MPLIALIPKQQPEMTYGTMERALKMADMCYGTKVVACHYNKKGQFTKKHTLYTYIIYI